MPATIELATAAIVFALTLGLPLGIFAAIRRDGPIDHLARLVSLIGVSIPIFWLARCPWSSSTPRCSGQSARGDLAPNGGPTFVTGFYTVDSLLDGDSEAFWSALAHLVLPGSCWRAPLWGSSRA